MIKEFKNGNIAINLLEDIKKGYINLSDNQWVDNFYYNELTMSDYYFNCINGYMYLVNYRTNCIYDFSDCYINILEFLKNELKENSYKIKLYPVSKRTAKSLFEDLNNGY